MKASGRFVVACLLIMGAGILAVLTLKSEYAFFACYTVLQFVVLAVAWNILGGNAGYINFGTAAFFALGAYTTVFLHKAFAAPFWVSFAAAGVISGLAGAGLAYVTVRLRGVYFAIATLAMGVVLHTFIVNWDFVGGARGMIVMPSEEFLIKGSANKSLFLIMLGLALGAVWISRKIQYSRIGRGLAAVRDDEIAAECSGVPTFRLKLIAASLSGMLTGLAGAPYPLFATYVDPASAFSLSLAINSLAMPLIGGTGSWIGPVVGAILIAGMQVIATVTISSEVNLLIVGVLLIVFVAIAPKGIVGWFKLSERKRAV
jgi:branched-chain amino acid transport system permease protein